MRRIWPLPLFLRSTGLGGEDASLLAIVLSHGHRDHWGLVPKVGDRIPLVMGKATERIIRAAADFVPDAIALHAAQYLEHGKRLDIGPFAITPRLVDHSGFDAYAMEVEAGGKRIFYSGDLRAHGRKGGLFEALINHPPRNIDTMLMEGSSLGRLAEDQSFPSEAALEEIFVDRFKDTAGMALVACSAQNIDRVVTVYRAAKRTGRTLIVDAYAAEVLKATDKDSIPKPVAGWSNLAVFIPQGQRIQLVKKNIASIVDSYRGFRLWPEQLAEHAPRLGHAVSRLDDARPRSRRGSRGRQRVLVAMGRLPRRGQPGGGAQSRLRDVAGFRSRSFIPRGMPVRGT